MSVIFIDTNVFYNVLFKTQLTNRSRKLLEDFEDWEFNTSLTVVNELLYVSIAKYYRSRGIAKGPLSLRKLVAAKGYPDIIMNGIKSLLDGLEVKVFNENVDYHEMMEVAETLKLLPSDAIIASACKQRGIIHILTFDEDFKRVPWLKVIS